MEAILKIMITAILLVLLTGLVLAITGELGYKLEILGGIVAFGLMTWMANWKPSKKKN